MFSILDDLAHVAGWDPHILNALAHSWVGSVLLYADPAQPLTTAGEELDHLTRSSTCRSSSVRGVKGFM